MNILLPGNHAKRYYMFKCKVCQCVFEAHSKEVDVLTMGDDILSITCFCPECGHKAYTENQDGYLKEDAE